MPQPQPRQQPGLNDIQMLQRHIMLKQLQEHRRQQQLQESGYERQQNHFNHPSATNKPAVGGHFLPLMNGTPIHDASQMLMAGNMAFAHHGASSAVQGFPNGLYSRGQSQDMYSMGRVPQQLEASMYGTPITSSRNNTNQYDHPQGLSHYSAEVLTKASDNQTEKPTIQSTDFGNSFVSENYNISSDQVRMSDGASKQFFPGRILPENFQQVNALQRSASPHEFNERQEQGGWPGKIPGSTAQSDPSQGLTTLDPLEQKILFNMDDDSWNASFGRKADMGTGGFGNSLEYPDYDSSFPSIQSGSWSALMQSAVAEASSSDTGLQEEWSGLSFQNTEPSIDNQPSTFVQSRNQQTGWVDKPQLLVNDSNMSSDFPGFQQLGLQFSIKQRDGMRSDSSHESVQQSPKMAPKWLDSSSRQNQPIEESHTIPPLENTWPWQSLVQSDGNVQGQNISSYNSHQPDDKLIRRNLESTSPSGNTTMNAFDDGNSINMNGAVYTEKGPEAYRTSQNYHQREDSNDRYRSNASQHTITEDETRENMWLHARVNQNASGQVLSQEISRGSSSHQQGYVAHFNFVGDAFDNAVDMEKGSMADIQRNSKASEEVPSRGNIRANVSASLDRSAGIYGSNLTSETRQNMLELLHKVDYTGDQRTVTHVSSTDSSSVLEAPEPETPETSMAKSHDQYSGSQRFGLRLAPPSQQSPTSNHLFSLQSPTQSGNSAATSPGPLHLRNQLHRPPVAIDSPKATFPGMGNRLPQFNHDTSQGVSQPVSINFGRQFPFLEAVAGSHPSLPSSLQLGSSTPPSLWANLQSQPGPSGIEPPKLPSDFPISGDSPNSNRQTHPWATRKQTVSGESGVWSVNSQGLDYGEEHTGKKRSGQQIHSDIVDQVSHTGGLFQQKNYENARHGDQQKPAVSATDLEAFGRSLKPSNLHQNYSLLHQVSSLNNVKTDSGTMIPEKNHGAGSDLNHQQLPAVSGHQMMYGHNSGVNNPINSGLNVAARLDSFTNRDVKMLSFDESTNASWEMAKSGRSYSQIDSTSDNMAPSRTEHSQISFPMAPSWFKHYGTVQNSQMPMYDARTVTNSAHQFPFRNPFDNSHMSPSMVQLNAASASQLTAATLAVGKSPPPSVLPPEAITWNLSSMSSRKRKKATTELLPWHQEVTHSSKRVHSISEAEIEWAEAANRFIEKVEYGAEMVEEAQPLVRFKRRLVLTTQLVQQLFMPAPAAILSADATSNYDSVAYFAAKLALGDACNLASCSRSDSALSSEGCDMVYEKPKTSERIGEDYFSKIAEDFISRANKLESDLFSLEKKALIADLRVEYQELERFCIQNRFAKFHSRVQPDAAETSSSNGATLTVPKSLPQRYVTAFPMPMAVPEDAPCFSL
ncbi:uncharacterized protein LOC131302252 isoform X2 [Rhododendron vialii]|uniref:uncharacterized protein LOC131302252 isoform X2 n=1 Tax=Rhododendron vialii TaxID=182163 RepID=UPI00266011A3|nr:uncharacterized protein LOC131302252 isoform X2 [Rhododendron vialii]